MKVIPLRSVPSFTWPGAPYFPIYLCYGERAAGALCGALCTYVLPLWARKCGYPHAEELAAREMRMTEPIALAMPAC